MGNAMNVAVEMRIVNVEMMRMTAVMENAMNVAVEMRIVTVEMMRMTLAVMENAMNVAVYIGSASVNKIYRRFLMRFTKICVHPNFLFNYM